jgi:hypothetical protein
VRTALRPVMVCGLLILTLMLSETVWACPVCGFGQDKARGAFIVTTGIMTVVPLTLIGGVIVWLRQRSLRANTDKTRLPVDR